MYLRMLRWMIGVLFIAAYSIAAEPEVGPSPRVIAVDPPPGFKTVGNATVTKFTSEEGDRSEVTSYLGVTVYRNDKGQVTIDDVRVNSPAAEAGIKKGEIITHIGNQPIRSVQAFREWLQTNSPGKKVTISLLKEGKKVDVTTTLTATSNPKKPTDTEVFLGLELSEKAAGEGIFIDRVSQRSPAETAGLKEGEKVLKVDGAELSKAELLEQLLDKKKVGEVLNFTVLRDKKEADVKVTLASLRGRIGGREFAPTIWKKEKLRVAVIGIEFSDIKHNPKMSLKDLETAIFSKGIYNDKGSSGEKIYGSLNDYLMEQSSGAFEIEGKVFDWVNVEKKRNDYVEGSGTSNKTAVLNQGLEKLTKRDGKDALEKFDAFMFLYAGDRVRSNAGSVYYPHNGTIPYQSKRVRYVLAAEGAKSLTPTGGFAKEFVQMLGLPSLSARTENIGSEGLGPWCALSDTFTTNRPQHLSPWAKIKLGWLTPTVIDPLVKQKLVLSPIEGSSKECFKVLVRPDGSEYLLLEVRKKKGFDTDLPGEGLLIWRVVGDRPILEESHGIEGPIGPTSQLAAVPFPSPANTSFTPDTTPSSKSPMGGGLPVHITEIRRLEDGKITFQIGYEYR
jgi:M6 family metalloprotease-like protein